MVLNRGTGGPLALTWMTAGDASTAGTGPAACADVGSEAQPTPYLLSLLRVGMRLGEVHTHLAGRQPTVPIRPGEGPMDNVVTADSQWPVGSTDVRLAGEHGVLETRRLACTARRTCFGLGAQVPIHWLTVAGAVA